MIARMDAKLGHPTRDPHGDPIPAADGWVPMLPARRLGEFDNGESGQIARVSDSDGAMLRYFDSVGVTLDVTVTVLQRCDSDGTVTIGLDTANESIELGTLAVQAIWLVRPRP